MDENLYGDDLKIRDLEVKLAETEQSRWWWRQAALEASEEVLKLKNAVSDEKSMTDHIIYLEAEVSRLTKELDTWKQRIDEVSDQLDFEIDKKIFHKMRAERLAWFIEHLSGELAILGAKADQKVLSESD